MFLLDSLLALKSHFAVPDNHPFDMSFADLGNMMLLHVADAGQHISSWQGKYYDACIQFARSIESEMQENNCTSY